MKSLIKWYFRKIKHFGQKRRLISLLVRFEQEILNNPSSSEALVELLAENNFYSEIKRPYYQKLMYFEEKYHSEMIKRYIDFCSK
ncbi:hypothetical protein QX233_22055 [Chryseobacterium gambrini]|uniref:Uncharacterized protein n=2 Tax=Chryseobacterium TaxID=59732 RepID=A0AAJ1VMD8_9FLAO|nr:MULTISPECIES: hypothetical protein [Chryseobacterium]MCF2219225.1 hypothetical protein [Chryseobacterium sp. PS-8]MDN4015136.1 hypothetical protein [Chryseobacterium gambrini]MDN4029297.1 hypothetical protein [Chryseobacterium gambrini]QWA39037.1 hypothetical protein KKI44_02160 [Chryseobacterium sp. ZHDP1]